MPVGKSASSSQPLSALSKAPSKRLDPMAAPIDGLPPVASDGLSLSVASRDSRLASYEETFGAARYVQDPADPALLKALGTAIARSPGLAALPLAQKIKAGSFSSGDVRALQRFLAGQGLSLGPSGVDGKLGPKTYQALLDHLAATAAPTPAPAPTPTPPTPAPSAPAAPAGELTLPPRPADAPGGRQFLQDTARLNRPEREKAILAQVLAGNVPDFERQLKEVTVSTRTPDGRNVTGTIKVLPDYLAIGSNEDYVRIPMSPLTAQAIADQLGCVLPTRKIVDVVYKQADVRLTPKPLPAGPQMMSNDYYGRHQALVDAQLAGQPLGALVAGDKKDVVVSNMLRWHPGRVAIYGWHQAEGKPIQGLSTVHEETYADYSHGIRLLAGTMTVDGHEMAVADVLKDPALAGLLSDEGAIGTPRYPTK